jgi:hypothetical protein
MLQNKGYAETLMSLNLFNDRTPLLLRKILRKFLIQYAFRITPKLSYNLYLRAVANYYRQLGIEKGVLVLSFDCDLEEDMMAVNHTRLKLQESGFAGSWALIGGWVNRFPEVVQQLIDNGHEIINHTMTHPDNHSLRPGDPRKFNQVSSNERRDEISKFHTLMKKNFSYQLRGFRAPHFRMTEDVYPVLGELGYIYSSSKFLENDEYFGVIHNTTNGVLELPLSTAPIMPCETLESYRVYRGINGKYKKEMDFYNHFQSIIEMAEKWKIVAVVYMDPCDVIRLSNPPFEEYVRLLSSSDIKVEKMDEVAFRFTGVLDR